MTRKEEVAKANGFDIKDPIMNYFDESTGQLENIPEELRIKLAKGLYIWFQ